MKKGNLPAAVPHRDYLLKRLSDPALAAAYLNAAVKDDDPAAFLQALRNVVDARGGVASIAERTDLNRQAVYRMLSQNGNPEFRSLQRLLGATGLGLNVVPAGKTRTRGKAHGPTTSSAKKKRRTKTGPLKLAA